MEGPAPTTKKAYSADDTLWLYTSLSSGSSQIVTATSRLETILKANRIPFMALDVATDEKARMLWGRRAGKRKLPGLVKMGMVIGDIDEIEEWNEYGELKEQVGAVVPPAPAPIAKAPHKTPAAASSTTTTISTPAPAAPPVPTTAESNSAAAKASTESSERPKPKSSISFAEGMPKAQQNNAGGGASMSMAMRQLGQEAAARANKNKSDALAARKAQLAATEKLDSSAVISPPSGSTEAVTAVSAGVGEASVASKTDVMPEVEEPNNTIPAVTEAQISETHTNDTKPTNQDEEEPTASAANADRPESPLPAPKETVDANRPEEIEEPLVVPTLKPSESVVSETSISMTADDAIASHREITRHRGSSISAASKEEIKEVEEANKIPEEPEAEEKLAESKPSSQGQHIQFAGEREGNEMDHVKEELARERSPARIEQRTASVDATINNDVVTDPESKPMDTTDGKTQDQPAAEPAKAIESVED